MKQYLDDKIEVMSVLEKHSADLFLYPSQRFKEHLASEGNSRILFSGKFGLGKTYFIKYFFRDDIQKRILDNHKYNAFHIYPVNYSIGSNEDIFRYVKYDVITSIMQSGVTINEDDLSIWNKLPFYARSKPLKVLATMLYMIPKIGKDLANVEAQFEVLRKDIEKYEAPGTSSEGDKLVAFLEELEVEEGSKYESGAVTKLIAQVLRRYKDETGRENVLIIDDLDRIDPEHIFRLLNVFAAHFDNSYGLPNKLGFDRVILICDVQNLRNIFRAKFGTATDFNGYIDKFYTSEIFYLDNYNILEKISYETFRSVRFSIPQRDLNLALHFLFNNEIYPISILQLMLAYGQLSLRSLVMKLANPILLDVERSIAFSPDITITQLKKPFLVHFRILKEICGSYDDIRDFVKRLPLQALDVADMHDFTYWLIYYLLFEKHKFSENIGNGYATLGHLDFRYMLHHKAHNEVELAVFEKKVDSNQQDVGYKFNKSDFVFLLSEFLDLMTRVRN